MENKKKVRGLFAVLICLAVMGLTSCVAILDDMDGTTVRSAYLPDCHDDEIILTYTGSLEDYDIEVEVYNQRDVKMNGYYIKDQGKFSDYKHGYSSEKKYVIQMNKTFCCGDMIIVKCSRWGKTISKVIYVD